MYSKSIIELVVLAVGVVVLMAAAGLFVLRSKEVYSPFGYKLAWAGVIFGIPFLAILIALGRFS